MSVKRLSIVLLALILISGFTYIGVRDAVKTKDNLEFQKVQLNSKQTEIKELNVKYEELNRNLDDAAQQKDVNQQEIQRLQDEKQQLEQQKKDLEAQLQAKINAKSSIASASSKTIKAATLTSTASAQSGGSVQDIITAAGQKYGVDTSYMLAMAMCESTLNPNAVNKTHVIVSGKDYGAAKGLYQFIDSTWLRMSAQAGYSGASVFDATANANVFAWAIANGRAGEWQCKR